MNKFIAYIRIGLVDGLEMRFQLLYWLYVNMAPILLMSYLWFHIYAKKENVGGYSLSMMITYYLLTRFINRIISTYSEERIAKEIKDGRLNQFIARPIDYLTYKFGERIGIRTINLLVVIPVYVLAAWILKDNIIVPLTLQNAAIIGLNLMLSIVSFFLLAYIIGMMAFFMVETHALNGLKEQITSIMSGYLFPLTLLPESLQYIFKLLPFSYYYHFPMQVYFNQLSGKEIIAGLAIQGTWIIISYLSARAIWHQGTKNYEATGI